MLNIFEFDDYKEMLKVLISRNPRGYVQKMADACGCQRSYLSQVIHGKPHLNADQCFKLAALLDFGTIETDFLLSILDRQKATSLQFRKYLTEKIKTVRKNQLRITKKVMKDAQQIEKASVQYYYSSWIPAAVHIASGISQLQEPHKMAERLSLSTSVIENTLLELCRIGLVKRREKKWVFDHAHHYHLKDNSPLIRMHHSNWRIKSLSSDMNPEKDLHYSSIFSISEDDLLSLKSEIINFIAKANKKIKRSPPNDLAVFNVDLFSP